jgi:hypothetical protein
MGRLIGWLLTQPLFWALAGVIGGPVLFVRGFGLLQRKRMIMDIPQCSVRSAALGQVEICGKAVGPYTLVAPLSHTDCLYYRVTVQSGAQGDLRNDKMRELCAPLFVDDGTGRLLVYPAGCELQLDASMYSAESEKIALAMVGNRSEPPEVVWERCVKPGDQIFVMGSLQENPWAKRNPVAESSELSRIGPGFVSAGEADVLRLKAYTSLDQTMPSGAVAEDCEHFDVHAPVILMKGNGPFVISGGSQRDLVQRLHWKSLLYIWGGPAAALWGLWKIFERAKAVGWLPRDF